MKAETVINQLDAILSTRPFTTGDVDERALNILLTFVREKRAELALEQIKAGKAIEIPVPTSNAGDGAACEKITARPVGEFFCYYKARKYWKVAHIPTGMSVAYGTKCSAKHIKFLAVQLDAAIGTEVYANGIKSSDPKTAGSAFSKELIAYVKSEKWVSLLTFAEWKTWRDEQVQDNA